VYRRRLATLIAALALVVPSAAFAQSAGDEQYQDPFGGDEQSQSDEPDTPAASGGTAQATPTATAAPAPTVATASQASPAAEQLPRTGDDAGLLALGGAVLLAGGVALRRRVS
jgi:LPXTG-motif cell wall-anchored protein